MGGQGGYGGDSGMGGGQGGQVRYYPMRQCARRAHTTQGGFGGDSGMGGGQGGQVRHVVHKCRPRINVVKGGYGGDSGTGGGQGGYGGDSGMGGGQGGQVGLAAYLRAAHTMLRVCAGRLRWRLWSWRSGWSGEYVPEHVSRGSTLNASRAAMAETQATAGTRGYGQGSTGGGVRRVP
jgi:hypothetical protein